MEADARHLRQQFNENLGDEVLPPSSTWAKANVLRMFVDATMRGGTLAAKAIADRIEDKPPQRLELRVPERKETAIEVVFRKSIPSPSSNE